LLFNRPQGLDCTWPRFGSASQVRFENSPALRTLTTSTFKSGEEEEKGSLPACSSWVVSACLATYRLYTYHMCQSVHARGSIHTTIALSLQVSSIQNLAYRIRKDVVSCVASTRQICFPAGAGEFICTSNLAQGQAAARVPDKPRQAPHVCCQPKAQGGPGTFTYRPACCLTK
jgi:hypothetical protein